MVPARQKRSTKRASSKVSRIHVIYTTVASKAHARSLAKDLVRLRYAGCVQIFAPVESFYRWHDEIKSEREFGLLIKTVPQKAKSCVEWIESHHPYDIPLVLNFGKTSVSEPYGQWIEKVLKNRDLAQR